MQFQTVLVTSLVLAACADPPPAAAQPMPATTTSDSPEPPTRSGLQLQCSDATFVLAERHDDVRIETDADTMPEILPRPAGMNGQVPVGMGCAQSAAGTQYLVVEYGETPFGCKVCEWFFVYDTGGSPMNESVPPLRGDGESLEANNDGYRSVLRALELRHPRITYAAPDPRQTSAAPGGRAQPAPPRSRSETAQPD